METNYSNELTRNVNDPFINQDFEINDPEYDMEVIHDGNSSFSLPEVNTDAFINKISSRVNEIETIVESKSNSNQLQNKPVNNSIDEIIRQEIRSVINKEFIPLIERMISDAINKNK